MLPRPRLIALPRAVNGGYCQSTDPAAARVATTRSAARRYVTFFPLPRRAGGTLSRSAASTPRAFASRSSTSMPAA